MNYFILYTVLFLVKLGFTIVLSLKPCHQHQVLVSLKKVQYLDRLGSGICALSSFYSDSNKAQTHIVYIEFDNRYSFQSTFYFDVSGYSSYSGTVNIVLVFENQTPEQSLQLQLKNSHLMDTLVINFLIDENAQIEYNHHLLALIHSKKVEVKIVDKLGIRVQHDSSTFQYLENWVLQNLKESPVVSFIYVKLSPQHSNVLLARPLDLNSVSNCQFFMSSSSLCWNSPSKFILSLGMLQQFSALSNFPGEFYYPYMDYCNPKATIILLNFLDSFSEKQLQHRIRFHRVFNITVNNLDGWNKSDLPTIAIFSVDLCPPNLNIINPYNRTVKVMYNCRLYSADKQPQLQYNVIFEKVFIESGPRANLQLQIFYNPILFSRYLTYNNIGDMDDVFVDVNFNPFVYDVTTAVTLVGVQHLPFSKDVVILSYHQNILENTTLKIGSVMLGDSKQILCRFDKNNTHYVKIIHMHDPRKKQSCGVFYDKIYSRYSVTIYLQDMNNATVATTVVRWFPIPFASEFASESHYIACISPLLEDWTGLNRKRLQKYVERYSYSLNLFIILPELEVTGGSLVKATNNFMVVVRPSNITWLYGTLISECSLKREDTKEDIQQLVHKGCLRNSFKWIGSGGSDGIFVFNISSTYLVDLPLISRVYLQCKVDPCYLLDKESAGFTQPSFDKFQNPQCASYSTFCKCGRDALVGYSSLFVGTITVKSAMFFLQH